MTKENGNGDTLSDSEIGALLALMQNSWDLMDFAKTQQWRATYYSLLLFVAIAGIPQIDGLNLGTIEKKGLIFVTWIGAIFAAYVIRHSQLSQAKARSRVKFCAEKFSGAFLAAWEAPDDFDPKTYDDKERDVLYTMFLGFFAIAGASIVTWVLCSA